MFIFFFNIMLTWKIMRVLKVSVLYRYIDYFQMIVTIKVNVYKFCLIISCIARISDFLNKKKLFLPNPVFFKTKENKTK